MTPIDGKKLKVTQALGTLVVDGKPLTKHSSDYEEAALAALDDPSEPTVEFHPAPIRYAAPYVPLPTEAPQEPPPPEEEGPEEPPVEDPEEPPVEDPGDPPVQDPPVDPGPGPNPALHPNEPAGFTPLYDNDGSHLIGAGWDTDNWTRDAQIVADADNPTGSGKAIRLTHRAGAGGPAAQLPRFRGLGTANGGTGYSGVGVRHQYWSYRRVVPVGQKACCGIGNGHKLAYFGMSPESKQGGGANEFFISLCVNTGWQIQLGGGGTSVDKFTNLFYPQSPGEEWHIEVLRDAGDKGQRNGTLRILVNGQEVPGSPWTGLTWDDPTRPGNLFDGMQFYHSQHAPDATHVWLEREWYVSGR
jgi:hypothetical protein